MNRFFITPDQRAGFLIRFDGDQAHQIRRVLRLRPGARVVALDGTGQQFECVLEELTSSRVTGRIVAESDATGEPRVRLTLYQSLLRREKMEWVLQKGTEIGVARFAPVITQRSLVRDVEDVRPEKLDRWRRIIMEAAEQSGRGVLPQLDAPVSLDVALPDALDHDVGLIAWTKATNASLGQALEQRPKPRDVALFIGPEGGFDAGEVEQAISAGIHPVTLGRRIFRTETAALVAAALILYELGEMD